MDKATAQVVLSACQIAGDQLANILQPRPPELSQAEFEDLRRRIGETLAYMFDFLIEPVIESYPDLNPFVPQPGG